MMYDNVCEKGLTATPFLIGPKATSGEKVADVCKTLYPLPER